MDRDGCHYRRPASVLPATPLVKDLPIPPTVLPVPAPGSTPHYLVDYLTYKFDSAPHIPCTSVPIRVAEVRFRPVQHTLGENVNAKLVDFARTERECEPSATFAFTTFGSHSDSVRVDVKKRVLTVKIPEELEVAARHRDFYAM